MHEEVSGHPAIIQWQVAALLVAVLPEHRVDIPVALVIVVLPLQYVARARFTSVPLLSQLRPGVWLVREGRPGDPVS